MEQNILIKKTYVLPGTPGILCKSCSFSFSWWCGSKYWTGSAGWYNDPNVYQNVWISIKLNGYQIIRGQFSANWIKKWTFYQHKKVSVPNKMRTLCTYQIIANMIISRCKHCIKMPIKITMNKFYKIDSIDCFTTVVSKQLLWPFIMPFCCFINYIL